MRTFTSAMSFVALSPGVMFACSVCGLASPAPNQAQYISMSLMLSAVPLTMIAGAGVWLYHRVKAAEAQAARQPEPALHAEHHVTPSVR